MAKANEPAIPLTLVPVVDPLSFLDANGCACTGGYGSGAGGECKCQANAGGGAGS